MLSLVITILMCSIVLAVLFLMGRDVVRMIRNNFVITVNVQDADYSFRSSPENVQARDQLWEKIIQRHRYLKAEKRRIANDYSEAARTRRAYLAGFEVNQRFLKDLLAIRGIPVWLTDARLDLLDAQEDRDNGGDEEGIPLQDIFFTL